MNLLHYLPKKDTNKFFEYRRGDLPLLITVPHDGWLKPINIRNRKFGKFVRDLRSLDFAEDISNFLFKNLSKSPYLLINKLHRQKLDVNRDIEEGAQTDKFTRKLWAIWHSDVRSGLFRLIERFGIGLYIDLHSHDQIGKWIYLGYGLDRKDFYLDKAAFNSELLKNKSTVRNLANKYRLYDSILGEAGLGQLLNIHSYAEFYVTPSLRFPYPDNYYFSGGYNIRNHNNESIDAIQIEIDAVYREKDKIKKNSEYFGSAILEFLIRHYKW